MNLPSLDDENIEILSRDEFVSKLGLERVPLPDWMQVFVRPKVEGWKEAGGAESAEKAVAVLREGRKRYLRLLRHRLN